MNIQEATKKALRNNQFMTRESYADDIGYQAIKIMPSNGFGNCKIYTFDKTGKELKNCKNWQPSADDLKAGDWIVVD